MPLFPPTGSRRSTEDQMIWKAINDLKRTTQNIPTRFPISNNPSDVVTDKGLKQTAHGFSVGTIIYWDSATSLYALCKANAAGTCVYDGVVSNVPDTDTFDIVYSGVIADVDDATFTDGTTYYLSEATAGDFRSTVPAHTFYQVPVFHCFLDSDGSSLNLLVYPGRPLGSSHLALVAGDATAGGGTGRIYSTATVYWDMSSAGTMSLSNGTITSSWTYQALTLGSSANPASSVDSYIGNGTTTNHLAISSSGINYDDGTQGHVINFSLALAQLQIQKTVASVVTQSLLTPTQLTVGATPATPTTEATLTSSALTLTASSAVVAELSATVLDMTLSATNSVGLAASQITDTSQAIQFRKISICDPTTGTVKNTWLPCSAPF